jgi:hypothetical protein
MTALQLCYFYEEFISKEGHILRTWVRTSYEFGGGHNSNQTGTKK